MLKLILTLLFARRCDNCGKKRIKLYPVNMFSETKWGNKVCKECIELL